MSHVHRLLLSDRYFFVNVNLRPRIITFRPDEYPLLIEVIREARERLKFLFCGYVLMPNHWHALIYPAYPLTISKVLHDTKKIATLRLHAVRHTRGPFWQHQFWDRFARHAREFRQRLDYMHRNPVQAGLVKRPEEWRWSSYNNFALDKATVGACPIQIDYVHLSESYRG
ncbi:MAG TPA: transposase [Candidatus Acidoferrales bacterium]|nr:transposase [Candidatus Acidoferrales bacterium]